MFTASLPIGTYPNFLRKGWFSNTNAGLLRDHIQFLIHQLMVEQATDKEAPAVQELQQQIDSYSSKADK